MKIADAYEEFVAYATLERCLEKNTIGWYKFRTREEAKRRIFEYVEMYYNRKRAHSTLGYLSPFEYERRAF